MKRTLAAFAVAAAACPALAAPFADPTRPPLVREAARPDAASVGPRLESVLIAPDRRVAVISGQQVTIGSRFGDGEVVGITETEVRIRKPGGEESLRLFSPDARRRPAGHKGK
jgi:MSHA biogenesis protein MshK